MGETIGEREDRANGSLTGHSLLGSTKASIP